MENRNTREVLRLPDYRDDEMLTQRAVADALNCHISTVRKEAQSGRLGPPAKICGRLYWRWRQVRQYIQHCEEEAAA